MALNIPNLVPVSLSESMARDQANFLNLQKAALANEALRQQNQFNPGLTQQQMALNVANLRGKDLQNEFYAPNIQSQIALRQAQTETVPMQARTNALQALLRMQEIQQKMNQPLSDIGKLEYDKRMAALRKEDTGLYDLAAKAKAAPKGTQIYLDPETGEFTFSQGALPMDGTGIGGAMYRKPGSLNFVKDENGNLVARSLPQNTQLRMYQNAITAIPRAVNFLEDVKEMAPFLRGPKDLMTTAEGVANRWLGTNFEAPNVRAGANAAMKGAAESLMAAFNFRSTDYMAQLTQDMIRQQKGETPDGYRKRITKLQNTLRRFAEEDKEAVERGIPLTEQVLNKRYQARQKFFDQAASEYRAAGGRPLDKKAIREAANMKPARRVSAGQNNQRDPGASQASNAPLDVTMLGDIAGLMDE